MKSFSAEVKIIGINPFVFVPAKILRDIFLAAGKSKGAIPVKGNLNSNPFLQTLVKYSGAWRLYLNGDMRKAAGAKPGDTVKVKIDVDFNPRITPMHPELQAALRKNKSAKEKFTSLSSSRQKEINRYLNALKTDASIERNVERIIRHLA
jgi:hypothetical protein